MKVESNIVKLLTITKLKKKKTANYQYPEIV
jgi:hypothetical protein